MSGIVVVSVADPDPIRIILPDLEFFSPPDSTPCSSDEGKHDFKAKYCRACDSIRILFL